MLSHAPDTLSQLNQMTETAAPPPNTTDQANTTTSSAPIHQAAQSTAAPRCARASIHPATTTPRPPGHAQHACIDTASNTSNHRQTNSRRTNSKGNHSRHHSQPTTTYIPDYLWARLPSTTHSTHAHSLTPTHTNTYSVISIPHHSHSFECSPSLFV